MTAARPTIRESDGASITQRLLEATPAFVFGLRLWASVCLTYYVTFALQLSEPTWAVTTAAIVCTPVLGASLRKAFFRMIGTVVGAIGIVILAPFVRQDRIGFLVGLALWCAVSAFVATLLRNFAAYAAALAGYTAAILASDVLGPVGTSGGDVIFLAINRAIEICVGILCAGVVLTLTDLGHSRRKLAAELASLSMAIMDGFADCFLTASSDLTQFQGLRRDLLRRVIALLPAGLSRTNEGERIVVWPSIEDAGTIHPFRKDDSGVRGHEDVPLMELAAIAVPFIRLRMDDESVLRKMAEQFALGHLREATRARFEQALRIARQSGCR